MVRGGAKKEQAILPADKMDLIRVGCTFTLNDFPEGPFSKLSLYRVLAGQTPRRIHLRRRGLGLLPFSLPQAHCLTL